MLLENNQSKTITRMVLAQEPKEMNHVCSPPCHARWSWKSLCAYDEGRLRGWEGKRLEVLANQGDSSGGLSGPKVDPRPPA